MRLISWCLRAFVLITLPALVGTNSYAQLPAGYTGRPYEDDSIGFKGPQTIPGRIELAYFDFGGEGVAYHDSTPANEGAVLNHQCFDYGCHLRPGIPYHIAFFRENEGVDISYTKDWADYKKPNVVEPKVNQLYVGWESNGEWTNYTVDVKAPGRYRIITIYANEDNKSTLWINNRFAASLYLPKKTGYYHWWDQATVGEIEFPEAGLQLLTLKYNKGPNLAYLDFIKIP